MPQPFTVAFSHVGIFVTDLAKMLDFYMRVFGFALTDRGRIHGGEIAFLTRNPREHHQLVLASGRPPALPFNVVQQISFRVDSLSTLRYLHGALRNEPVTELSFISHGIAISVYCRDPEGNRLELFIDSPWYVEQPLAIPLDEHSSDEELWKRVEEQARTHPGFQSRAEWEAELATRLATL